MNPSSRMRRHCSACSRTCLQGPVGVAIYVLPRALAVPLVFVRFGYFIVVLVLVGWIFGAARASVNPGVTRVGAASGSGAPA